MAKVCIFCYKEKDGRPVADDFVIRTIRKAKEALHIAKNNTLVVCPECMETYAKKRAKYERDLAIHAAIGGLVLLLFVLLPLFTTGFSIVSVLLGLLLFCLIMAFTVFSHCPKMEDGSGAPKAAAQKPVAPAGRKRRNARKK